MVPRIDHEDIPVRRNGNSFEIDERPLKIDQRSERARGKDQGLDAGARIYPQDPIVALVSRPELGHYELATRRHREAVGTAEELALRDSRLRPRAAIDADDASRRAPIADQQIARRIDDDPIRLLEIVGDDFLRAAVRVDPNDPPGNVGLVRVGDHDVARVERDRLHRVRAPDQGCDKHRERGEQTRPVRASPWPPRRLRSSPPLGGVGHLRLPVGRHVRVHVMRELEQVAVAVVVVLVVDVAVVVVEVVVVVVVGCAALAIVRTKGQVDGTISYPAQDDTPLARPLLKPSPHTANRSAP